MDGALVACSWYNPTTYGTCAGDVAKSVAGDAFDAIAKSFGDMMHGARFVFYG